MKLTRFAILISALFLILFTSYSPSEQEERYSVILDGVLSILQNAHYSPQKIDDQFAEKIFNLYIERMDYGKKFLLKSDSANLERYKKEIDDELLEGYCDFFHISYDILNKRINEAKEIYSTILAKPFDYSREEEIELDPKKISFAGNREQLCDIWRKQLQYESMVHLTDDLEIQEKAIKDKDTSVKIKSYDTLEADSRQAVKKRYDDLFHRLGQVDKNDRFEIYVNSILNIYDPHTSYFAPKDKEDFDIRMSGSLEGIGALLSQRDEYIRVEEIIPGSPSWKQGKLKKDDIILKVAQGSDEPVDIVDMRLDNAVRLIRGKKGTEVRLTVKKPDGKISIIPIIRDVVEIEDSFAKSLIIQSDEKSDKIGYIKLPTFYIDFKDRNGRSCSQDVKQEILKLNNEKVRGLILDLRDNGGGSLDEVVKMAGLFIDKGPIVQVNQKNGKVKVLEDYDNNIFYNGPLVILVNTFSASASEILAAAMQDYKRAVIIGSASTYGKGTVQRFDDLDMYSPPDFNHMKPLGSVKYTIQKFYRINGKTTQLNGVTPDIIIPDHYKYIEIGEKDMEYPLPGDEITPANYNEKSSMNDMVYNAESVTRSRIAQDKTFVMIDENARRLKQVRDNSKYPLNIEKYKSFKKQLEDESIKYEKIGKDTLNFVISNLQPDMVAITKDSVAKEKNELWIGSIKKDLYLNESLKVMNDLIRINN